MTSRCNRAWFRIENVVNPDIRDVAWRTICSSRPALSIAIAVAITVVVAIVIAVAVAFAVAVAILHFRHRLVHPLPIEEIRIDSHTASPQTIRWWWMSDFVPCISDIFSQLFVTG